MNAIDTNILVYVIDADEPIKRPIASKLVERLDSANTVIPWQVICEYGATVERVRRRGGTSLSSIEAVQLIQESYSIVFPDEGVLANLLEALQERQLSYWDALLLSACARVGVDTLYSEDMTGVEWLGIKVLNPFVQDIGG